MYFCIHKLLGNVKCKSIYVKGKQTKTSKISLYLDIYKGITTDSIGKTKYLRDYEYLNLYLFEKPKSFVEKQHNKDTLLLAESIKSKRELELKNNIYGFTNNNKNTNFLSYFQIQAEKRKNRKSNYQCWKASIKYFKQFSDKKLNFKDLNETFCENYKIFLERKAQKSNGEKISTSTAAVYFESFVACINQAIRDKIIIFNPCVNVKKPRIIEKKKEFLSLEELKLLVNIPCKNDIVKRAFLFSCLTGLRWSDIHKLKWAELQQTDMGWRITFNQQKTKNLQYLDISNEARILLGEPLNNDNIFYELHYTKLTNSYLNKWLALAGINKKNYFSLCQTYLRSSPIIIRNWHFHAAKVARAFKYKHN